jgi:hypothetical protein
MRFARFACVFCLFLAFSSVCSAQNYGNSNNTGLPDNGAFVGSGVESVQINNGNLHVDIPIWSAKGRGLDNAARFVYDSKGWYIDGPTPGTFCDGGCLYVVRPVPGNTMVLTAVGPFTYTISEIVQSVVCKYNNYGYNRYSSFVLLEPNGTKHHFAGSFGDYPPYSNRCDPPAGATYYSDDGSGWILKGNSDGSWSAAVNKHGVVVSFQGGTIVKDTNGNELVSSTSTDTLGRVIGPTSYYDSSGTLRSFVTATTSVSIQTNLCQFSGYNPANGDICIEWSGTWTVPSKITLPNGQSYSFTYAQNAGGEITSITLPSGAQVNYTYASGGRGGPVGCNPNGHRERSLIDVEHWTRSH